MERYFNKVSCIIPLCFIANLFNIAWANDVQSYYVASKPLILHTLPAKDHYLDYDSAEIFVDSDNRVIVLSSFGFRWNGGYKEKILLFVFDNKTWVNSEQVLPNLQVWRGIVNNGVFQAYKRNSCPTIYSLTPDAKLSSQPAKTIKMDKSEKVFKREDYRVVTELLPLEGDPNKFFIVGYYVEERLNPIDLIRRVMSAGHWGFVHRPFGAIVEQDQITGYYNTPEKLETNERSEIVDSVISYDEIHCVGVKSKDYSYDPVAIQYLSFDLSDKHWTEPVELFKGHKCSEETREFFKGPSIGCNIENIYCAWSRSVSDQAPGYKWPIRTEESGIYFCSRTNGVWEKPIKIADFIDKTGKYLIPVSGPQVLVDKNGAVYVFWLEENEGLFSKHKTETGWSEVSLVIKDVTIRTKETGIPGPPDQPFGIVADKNNNLHIIYIRESCGAGRDFTPEQLIYVKLTHAQK
jgi:hypothetical protein